MQKHFEAALEPLTTLANRVSDLAELCPPDTLCTEEVTQGINFDVTDFDTEPEVDYGGEHLTLTFAEQPQNRHIFTDWSRSQLLAHLGAREKWFSSVSRKQQALELSRRSHTFEKHRFRTMSSGQPGVSIVRGLVSKDYADIPDTMIMDALLKHMGSEGRYIRHCSGKTDKALYAYCVAGQTTVGLTGVLEGDPGFVLRNSEVGYTSFWLIPYLCVPYADGLHPVVLERKCLLRRVHRGSTAELQAQVTEALGKLSAVWEPLTESLRALRAIRFPTEDDAVAKMREELLALKASRASILAYEYAYRAANRTIHDGAAIFQAVLTANRASTKDEKYDEAQLAGALLLRLL